MKPVKPVTAPGPPRFADVRAGDTVSFVSNGRDVRFVVGSIDGDGFTSREGVRYQRADVTQLKRRSTNWAKTTVLVTGVGAVTFFAIAYALFAQWDPD